MIILSNIEPLADSKGEPPLAIGNIPVTSTVRSTRDEVSLPVASACISPVEYPLNIIPSL